MVHRAHSKSRKFGLSDPPDVLDAPIRATLANLIKQRPFKQEQSWRPFQERRVMWEIQSPAEGYQLVAYEVVNELPDELPGLFWFEYTAGGLWDVFKNRREVMEADRSVGRTDKLAVWFMHDSFGDYKVSINTWWIPTKITKSQVS
jgi:hypothetical protein